MVPKYSALAVQPGTCQNLTLTDGIARWSLVCQQVSGLGFRTNRLGGWGKALLFAHAMLTDGFGPMLFTDQIYVQHRNIYLYGPPPPPPLPLPLPPP